jgi:hypothetical protein
MNIIGETGGVEMKFNVLNSLEWNSANGIVLPKGPFIQVPPDRAYLFSGRAPTSPLHSGLLLTVFPYTVRTGITKRHCIANSIKQ